MVFAALQRELDRSFAGAAPPLFNRDGEPGVSVDGIGRGDRLGYAFAIQQTTTRMTSHYPGGVRFREAELMQGIRRAVLDLDLAPVIHYARDGGVYIVNLWERGA